jgi:glycosyltransferase involved in cell wall biosynthesis
MLESIDIPVKILKCEKANLSQSRNIGIAGASGDVVAFLDDDAIPEPEWLEQLADAYNDPEVGGVGGFVYDHTGYEFQETYCTVNRLGNALGGRPYAEPELSHPFSHRFPHLLGANSSFRRSCLIEVGGFDEEYEYFLDETDVCLRVIDAGYLIRQLPNAFVHHKFAPSDVRGDNRVPKYRYPILKNKFYFALKNAPLFHSSEEIEHALNEFVSNQRNEVLWAIGEGLLPETAIQEFETHLLKAEAVGRLRGTEGARQSDLLTEDKLEKYSLPFSSISINQAPYQDAIVFVTNDYPPNVSGGVGVFISKLAQGLAEKGCIVHVVCSTEGFCRVDFEEGVWVHRIITQSDCEQPADFDVPDHIWNWSYSALCEVKRIATHRKVGVVEAPIWDCQGVAFLDDGSFPLITNLQTTLEFFLDSHPELRESQSWMDDFGKPMLATEKKLMMDCSYVRTISRAIRFEIEARYGFEFDASKVWLTHLGLPDVSSTQSDMSDSDSIKILFVGRLEERKGIDTLLKAAQSVLENSAHVEFDIVGEDTTLSDHEDGYEEKFRLETEASVNTRVCFHGKVSDEVLLSMYENADIFVAPSLFESFGLIFLEAMRARLPVVGTNVGGIPEIVEDGTNGFLVGAEEPNELAEALLTLVESRELRISLGEEGRKIFEERFTVDALVEKTLDFFNVVGKRSAH